MIHDERPLLLGRRVNKKVNTIFSPFIDHRVTLVKALLLAGLAYILLMQVYSGMFLRHGRQGHPPLKEERHVSSGLPIKAALVLPFIESQMTKLEVQVASWNHGNHGVTPCSMEGVVSGHSIARHRRGAFTLQEAPDTEATIITRPPVEYTLVFMYDGPIADEDNNSISRRASSIFRRIGNASTCFQGGMRVVSANVPARFNRHPCGPCHMFYSMLDLFWGKYDYFMIMEPDLTPVRRNWLDRLSHELALASSGDGLFSFWVRGSVAQCDARFGDIAERQDLHLNGNALYSLRDPDFLEFIRRVKAFYPAGTLGCSSGCSTGAKYESGYDHCFYRFLHNRANYEYARIVLRNFQQTPTIINMCEDDYDQKDILERFPYAYLVHSKGPTQSRALLDVRKAMQEIWGVFTDYDLEQNMADAMTGHNPIRRLEEVMCMSHRYKKAAMVRPARRCLALCTDNAFNQDNPDICKLHDEQQQWARFAPGKPYLWTTDLHAAPFGCNRKIYEDAGAITHAEVDFGNCKFYDMCPTTRLKVLSNTNMRGYGLEPRPNEMRRALFDAYKNDPEFQRVDAFVCSHPVANCELYMPFNRTLIVYATTRAEFGRFDKNVEWRKPFLNVRSPFRWEEWVDNLQKIAAIPGNIIAANNMYDVAYIKHFTGLDAEYLPSWCGDLNAAYAPKHSTILVGPYRDNLGKPYRSESKAWDHPIMRGLRETNERSNSGLTFARMGELYEEYTFDDVASHPAMVFMPYQVSVMSFFEYYRLGLPIFAPSKKLLLEWNNQHDFAWERIYGWPHRLNETALPQLPDPNVRENLKHWVQFCDVYIFPHVQLFDNWNHLLTLLQTVDLKATSRAMLKHSAQQRDELRARWRDILRTAVPPGSEGNRIMPTDFDQAMLELYGVRPLGPDPPV